MRAQNVSPYLTLVLMAAMIVLPSVAVLSADRAVIQSPSRPITTDPLYEQLQSLRENGAITAAQWEMWRVAWRQQNNLPPISGTLDQGGEDCATATVIPGLPYTVIGTTAGAADNYNYYCPWEYGGAPDVVYQYTPAQDMSVVIDLCESSYDTKVFVYAGSCIGNPVACNDNACGNVWGYPWASRVDCLPLTGGTTYYIVVDGFSEFEYGSYLLNVAACTPCTEPPVHDLRQNAKIVTSFPYTDTDHTFCAHHDCGAYPEIYTDVWYRFTVSQMSDVTINFCGSDPVLEFVSVALMSSDEPCTPLVTCDEENYVICSDFNPTVRWLNVPPGTYCYPVMALYGNGQTYTININGPVNPVANCSGHVTLTDTRPTNRRFELTHESGEISWFAFTGFCPGTTGQTVSHADSEWTVMANGDGNDGDSIIFVTTEPLTEGSIGTFVLRYPDCTSDLNWVVGSETGVIPGSGIVPRKPGLAVHQNSPNPFNPSTTIRFDLAEAAHVRVAVYNLMGQEVSLLMDRMTEAGSHAVEFNAGNLTSGVYLCGIEIPGDQQRFKMLLVK